MHVHSFLVVRIDSHGVIGYAADGDCQGSYCQSQAQAISYPNTGTCYTIHSILQLPSSVLPFECVHVKINKTTYILNLAYLISYIIDE